MNPIVKKLLMKPGSHWLIVNAPEDYIAYIDPLPEGVQLSFESSGKVDGVQLFVKNKAELGEVLKAVQSSLKHDTVIWFTYPKKNTSIPTDLEMMGSWDEAAKYNLRPVASAAINNIWTALRFKPQDQVKVSASRNSEIKTNDYSAYIDVDKKQVTLPPDALEALQQSPGALAIFNQLAYSHRKEYVVWVLSAKQEKTRVARVEKMVEMLLSGKRNPSEK
ncbi:YdeI/OmpD-associated family protein [Mucilaginibacter agri]|uniref:Bacteriocin-protection, YdeI or OmpD-Associated n=1 Tax=Mucilaginibacter agri TaxID=2695265 RepID=A0A965ZG09_9SPHI|nr:YdeI/OmpD-associated family protein [Mucilaginibacter agri]NCD69995.1 hypothetical protein [Mucilaginibacter agri]